MSLHYYQKRLVQDFFNFSLLFRRDHDSHIVSMHQAGTHWLRNLITHVIAKEHGLPIPDDIRSDDVVGSIKKPPTHGGPVVVQTHSIPSSLFACRALRGMLRYPKYLVLVRDPRVMLASHYKKRKKDSAWSFSEYLRSSKKTRQFRKNIWWDLRFQNSWAKMLELRPGKIHLVRYEDLRRDTPQNLRAIMQFLGMPNIDEETLDYCIKQSSKEVMAQKEAPELALKTVWQDNKNPLAIYSDDDKRFFLETYRKYCKADFGYDLETGW